jgi:hypothetical protein
MVVVQKMEKGEKMEMGEEREQGEARVGRLTSRTLMRRSVVVVPPLGQLARAAPLARRTRGDRRISSNSDDHAMRR